MSRTFLSTLRAALFSHRREFRRQVKSSTARRRIRLHVEALEARLLLAHTPGTLADEHEAVMEMIDFADIHTPAFQLAHGSPDYPSNQQVTSVYSAAPTYYKAIQDPAVTDGTYLWSNVNDWVVETYNTSYDSKNPNSLPFTPSPAKHVPTTGDDVEIPTGMTITYDLGPDAFANLKNMQDLPGLIPSNGSDSPSVKNNLRLHTVGVEGTLTFKPNSDLLMYFETMVVAPGANLTINETDPTHTVRMVIAAPDWKNFSLANPFDTAVDPFEFARGLISHGTVNMTGENVTPYVTVPQLTMKTNNVYFDGTNVTSPPKLTAIVNGRLQTSTAANNAFQFTVPANTPTTGWTVGDSIVVTGTDPNKVNSATGASSDEEATIVAINNNGDGTTSYIAQAQISTPQKDSLGNPLPPKITKVNTLQYDHVPPVDPNTGKPYADANGNPQFGIQITDLTRNINIQSEDPYHTMARGQTMFMHAATVNISGVGFLGLGRTDKRTVVDDVQFYTQDIVNAINQAGVGSQGNSYLAITGKNNEGDWLPIPGTGLNPRGRYAVHFHRAGIDETDSTDPNDPMLKPGAPAEVQDSVVVDSPGWGFVNHSSNVDFDNNVAFNVIGASFVTEAGNEVGRFTGNLAIKGIGANTSESIESRKVKQDFGFQGDGFWFQGASIQVDNNIAVSQKHDGFVFFTQPLVQNYKWADPKSPDPMNPTILSARQGTMTTTTILAAANTNANPIPGVTSTGYDPALIAALGGPGKSIDPGNVPILSFKNNTALADGTGMETWFHLLGSNLPRTLGSQIVGLNVANTRGTGMFDPYTNLLTVSNTTLIGNPASPGGTGMNRNDVTANFTYDNDTIRGFALGVAVPVNGTEMVNGGTYQNKRNFEITTANSQTRTVQFNDKTDASGNVISLLSFQPLLIPTSATNPAPTAASVANEAARINIDLRTNYDPKERDISKMFNPDIIRMGTVWLNSFALGINPASGPKQLYYYQQASSFTPFPSTRIDDKGAKVPVVYGAPVTDKYGNIIDYTGIEVPPELIDKNNSDLKALYGLSIGAAIAPTDATDGMGTYTYTDPLTKAPSQTSPRINGLIGSTSTYQVSLDATSARYTQAVDPMTNGVSTPLYQFSYRFMPTGSSTNTNVTLKIGNFGTAAVTGAPAPAASYLQLDATKFFVNGAAIVISPPTGLPSKPVPPASLTKVTTTGKTQLTPDQKALNTAIDAYNSALKDYTAKWANYYNQPVKLSLRQGWNEITGNLEGNANIRTQLIYGDITAPDLNLTSPDAAQLRRLSSTTTVDANGKPTTSPTWGPGTWDATPTQMRGISLGDSTATVGNTFVTGQFVAVMHPDDLSFGFDLKGQIVDNSFGHKSFEVLISNLSQYLVPSTDPSIKGLVPITTTPADPTTGNPLPNYANILNYQSFKNASSTTPTYLTQRLQTIFFAVKDTAGNSKTFALTIYLDPTAPRVGGSANPSGSVTPSASMISLANSTYIIDMDTFLLISLTAPKKTSLNPPST